MDQGRLVPESLSGAWVSEFMAPAGRGGTPAGARRAAQGAGGLLICGGASKEKFILDEKGPRGGVSLSF